MLKYICMHFMYDVCYVSLFFTYVICLMMHFKSHWSAVANGAV